MISLSQLRKNLYQIFKLLRESGFEVEVYHEGKVYKLYAVPLEKPAKATYRPRKRAISTISYDDCSSCGELIVNGVCMNPGCPSLSVP